MKLSNKENRLTHSFFLSHHFSYESMSLESLRSKEIHFFLILLQEISVENLKEGSFSKGIYITIAVSHI